MSYVKEARKAAGLSLNKVARAAETSPNYVSEIELGKKTPSVTMAKKLAEVLGIEWVRFFD